MRTTDYGAQLQGLIAEEWSSNTLLLGVGNHFALDFGSRTMVVEVDGKRETVDRDDVIYFDPAAKENSGRVSMDRKRGWILRRDFRNLTSGETE